MVTTASATATVRQRPPGLGRASATQVKVRNRDQTRDRSTSTYCTSSGGELLNSSSTFALRNTYGVQQLLVSQLVGRLLRGSLAPRRCSLAPKSARDLLGGERRRSQRVDATDADLARRTKAERRCEIRR